VSPSIAEIEADGIETAIFAFLIRCFITGVWACDAARAQNAIVENLKISTDSWKRLTMTVPRITYTGVDVRQRATFPALPPEQIGSNLPALWRVTTIEFERLNAMLNEFQSGHIDNPSLWSFENNEQKLAQLGQLKASLEKTINNFIDFLYETGELKETNKVLSQERRAEGKSQRMSAMYIRSLWREVQSQKNLLGWKQPNDIPNLHVTLLEENNRRNVCVSVYDMFSRWVSLSNQIETTESALKS
jgi:hypothetical protein